MRTVVNWLITPVLLVFFFLVLILFEVLGRITRPISLNLFEMVMAGLQWTMMRLFTIFGLRIQVEKSRLVNSHAPYLIISNHQSLFDIAMIGGILFWNLPKYVAKKELTKGIPAVSLNLSRGHHALIDRSDSAQAMRAIEGLGRTSTERGTSAVIFPEGTRSQDGSLRRFRRNGTLALLSSAPTLSVVPITIDGSWALNSFPPFPTETEIVMRIGDPIERSPGDEDRVLDRAVAEIRATMADLREPE